MKAQIGPIIAVVPSGMNASVIAAPSLLPKTKGPKKRIFIVNHNGIWCQNWRGWFCITNTNAEIGKEICMKNVNLRIGKRNLSNRYI